MDSDLPRVFPSLPCACPGAKSPTPYPPSILGTVGCGVTAGRAALDEPLGTSRAGRPGSVLSRPRGPVPGVCGMQAEGLKEASESS